MEEARLYSNENFENCKLLLGRKCTARKMSRTDPGTSEKRASGRAGKMRRSEGMHLCVESIQDSVAAMADRPAR